MPKRLRSEILNEKKPVIFGHWLFLLGLPKLSHT